MSELPLTTAVQTEHWILDLPRLQVIDVELRPLGEDEAKIQLVDAALADFLTPKDPGQHVPTEPELRNFLRGFIDGLLKPNLSKDIERAVSVSYSGGQATVVLKTDKATAAAISRHIDKAASQDGVSKAAALEKLIFNRTSTKVVINTYRTGEDTSRVFIPSAGWCELGEYLMHDSVVRTLRAEGVQRYVPSEEITRAGCNVPVAWVFNAGALLPIRPPRGVWQQRAYKCGKSGEPVSASPQCKD